MAFVKLDCGILNSTLWVEREQRDVFITALLMAAPFEVREPMEQYEVDAIKKTGFVVPAGWYGFVEAAGPGIVRRALADPKEGMEALRRLGDPDEESRSSEFDGRRLVRVDGGYIVLNYMKYRDKDATAAVRSARYRERKKLAESEPSVTRDVSGVTRDSSRRVTIAEAEAEAEAKTEIQKSPPAARVPPADAGQRAAKKCPESFKVTSELAAWAEKKTPGVDIETETDKLRDHTFANARKDWDGTWRNWMRNAFADLPRKVASESFRERDLRLAAERVRDATGGLCHDRSATGERPREILPFERGYVETIEGEAHEQLRIVG